MTARNLALEALKELVAHFGEEHSGKFYEGGCALCIAIERANAAIAALEAETGEVAAWIGHSQVTGLKFAAMPDEHRSEACAPWIPTYTAPPPAVPPGWKLVPIEPTEAMLGEVDEEVGGHCYVCTRWKASYDDCRRVYSAMLAAAPGAPA